MSITRRTILLSVPAYTVSRPAHCMDPITLAIVTTLISAGAAIWSARAAAQVAADSQLRALEMQWAMEQAKLQSAGRAMPAYPIGNTPVRQETAYGYDGQALSVAWTDDIDGAATYAGLSRGRIGLQRGHYEGVITNSEARRFSEGIRRGEPMAVPVEGGYHTFSARESDRLKTVLAGRLNEGDSFLGGRNYSRARRPSESGWDLQSVMVADRKGEVHALAVSRNALRQA